MKLCTFVGVGCNQHPQKNIPAILDSLLGVGNQLSCSSIFCTEPVGESFSAPFYNFCVALIHFYQNDELKDRFNRIEVSLGRNRQHPESSRRDRPADLDILFTIPASEKNLPEEFLPQEDYLNPCLLELADFLGLDYMVKQKAQLEASDFMYHGFHVGTAPFQIGK